MTERLFPILGTEEIPLIGRSKLINRVWSNLTKPTPSNLSVVGPRYIGKTVLLKALAERASAKDSPYRIVLYWEVGCNPPQSDDQFRSDLCDHLHDALGRDPEKHSELRAELAEDKSHSTLKEVLDWLDKDSDKVLMIWDGFDKPLSQGHLTGSLFGQLRSYFNDSSHTIVTAARALQSELAADKHVEDSPFWNMFDVNPIRVGPLEQADWQAAFAKGGFSPMKGGEKELLNWSGGNPILLLSILNHLHTENQLEFDNIHVSQAAKEVSDSLADFIDKLWGSCSADAKATYRSLIEQGELASGDVSRDTQLSLTSQGLAAASGTKLKPACGLLQQHIQASKGQDGGIRRSFGNSQDYESNIRELLEIRLSHVVRPVNARLHKLVRQAINELPTAPEDCFNNFTRIEELSLDTVWKVEAESSETLPGNVVSAWTSPPCNGDRLVQARMDNDDWTIPTNRLQQILLLERLTGSRTDFTPMARCVSKHTYLLLNAIHSFRNRTEHTDGQQMPVGVAASALLLCVELLSCLERELGNV